MKSNGDEEDRLPDDDERRAAAELARVLDGEAGHAEAEALATARSIRAAAGREAPLGELRARGLAKAAVAEAARRVAAAAAAQPRARSRWSTLMGLAAVVAVVVLLLTLWRTRGLTTDEDELPARLYSRSAGRLVPGPFPSTQTATQRLDLVTSDRLVALRDLRARRGRAGDR